METAVIVHHNQIEVIVTGLTAPEIAMSLLRAAMGELVAEWASKLTVDFDTTTVSGETRFLGVAVDQIGVRAMAQIKAEAVKNEAGPYGLPVREEWIEPARERIRAGTVKAIVGTLTGYGFRPELRA